MKPAALDAIVDEPFALERSALAQVRAVLSGEVTVSAALRRQPSAPRSDGVISILPIHGHIEHRSSLLGELFGGTSLESFRAAFRGALADPSVLGIVLDIDSPGGSVSGLPEMAAEIRDARGTKPIVAVANTLAASAAYWLGSQADQMLVTPSGVVGSIGVVAIHQDESQANAAEGITTTIISVPEHKADGSPFEPLSDEARADILGRVRANYGRFVADVAKGRRTTVATVEADYGQGRILDSDQALAAGMVDGIGTIDDALRITSRRVREQSAELAGDAEPIAPFHQRVMALRRDSAAVLAHAKARAELRAKEGRPAFSDDISAALAAIRDDISALLLPVDPEAALPVVEPPAPAVEPPPIVPPTPAAITTPRFATRDAWLDYVEGHAQ